MCYEQTVKARENITAWWEGELLEDRVCASFSTLKPGTSEENLNKYWPSPEQEPDLEGFVDAAISNMWSREYWAETLPVFPHLYGSRGTPMTMAAYLGAPLRFANDTVWFDPIVEDWDEFEVKIPSQNEAYQLSQKMLGLAAQRCDGSYAIELPDLGDALTVFSLIRGVEKLLFDVVESKAQIVAARDKFIELWPQVYEDMWSITRAKAPGATCWLAWAPGSTYACQCDFSTMISPAMFEELVVPEVEKLGEYLQYIVWHLDGPEDEIKHLDILLGLPPIKAIQWNPSPQNSVLTFIPYLKKVQAAGKSLIAFPANEQEVETLLSELSPRGLFLYGGFTGKTAEDAKAYIRMLRRLTRRKIGESAPT